MYYLISFTDARCAERMVSCYTSMYAGGMCTSKWLTCKIAPLLCALGSNIIYTQIKQSYRRPHSLAAVASVER